MYFVNAMKTQYVEADLNKKSCTGPKTTTG
jgi:hypothetical protein